MPILNIKRQSIVMILTSGALAKICAGQEVIDPVLQVVAFQRAERVTQEEMYVLLLNDGKYFSDMEVVLAPILNNLIHEGEISPFTIIKVKSSMVHAITYLTKKKLVEIRDVEVIKPGYEVGKKIGRRQILLHDRGFKGFSRSS